MATRANAASTKPTRPRRERLQKDLVLLQLALVLMDGGELSYARLVDEFRLERRTAERYLADLKRAGLPVDEVWRGREKTFRLAPGRARTLAVEAIDIPPRAARPLSLLLVAAKLLPAHLGVKEAVDATVRAALRLRGVKASVELRRLEDVVRVLENDAKDYAGKDEVLHDVIDATLEGRHLVVRYRSPKSDAASEERFFPASLGLYKGGLYVLAVDDGDDGSAPRWRALERILDVEVGPPAPSLPALHRQRALDVAARRWGPARPDPAGTDERLVTLHFSRAAAPYVLARLWHPHAEIEAWPDDDGGGARMAIRLAGDPSMFESWVRSWGPEVVVLRPRDMALRIAQSFEDAARGHREGAARFAALIDDDER